MKKPIIAITLDYHTNSNGFYYSERPWYALRSDYSSIIARLGAVPIFVSHEHNVIDDVLSIADGLIIPGGDYHIPPSFYGQKSEKVEPGEERAAYELDLMRKAFKLNMPILGICHGMQLLNVSHGGSLKGNVENHLQPSPKSVPYHAIKIEKKTKLFDLAGGRSEFIVTSSHKQAIDKLGQDLMVSARAKDGVIEAIESTKYDFVIGVEWHPEYGCSELDEGIFKRLIKKAKRKG